MASRKAPPSWTADGPLPSMGVKQQVSGEYRTKSEDPSTGPAAFGLSIARVVRVDYALFQVALNIFTGEKDVFQWAPIPVTSPAAGARHFMGALPEAGDMCVVGWLATKPKTPVILGWLPIAVTSGNQWMPIQDFLPTEVDVNPKTQAHFEGIYGRYRHKMRQMRPGVLYLSSSQGSEVYLDEGVVISNRRSTEIRLRDQDQAMVFRSLQQFHAMGGARIYGGMVQRDATYLPRRMFSDGVNWDAPVQVSAGGDPLLPFELGDSEEPTNALTPNRVFVRSSNTLPFADSGLEFEDNVDPYSFLARGLFIGVDGYALDPTKAVSDAEYGGKPIFRVSIDPNTENTLPPVNGLLGEEITDSDTLTEYRIELDHTWDGRLPVTEQTDGFDADRLPSDAVQESSTSSSGPYLQFVLGSVVGNDPFTRRGRDLYGLPLTPVIFEGDEVIPRLESGVGVPLGKHAATLFRLDPPNEDPSRLPPTFISTTKDGSVRGFIGGPQDGNSLELALNGGMKVRSNGPMVFDAPNTVLNFRNADPLSNYAASITSDTGAILIRGNAPTTQGSFSARTTSTDLQENNLPSVLIEAPSGNVHVKAGRFTKISGANGVQLVDTNEVLIASKQNVNTFTDKWLLQCNTVDKTVQGKEVNAYSGPKNFLPTNAPLRETKFIATPLTGHAGGDTDKYVMWFGNRDERFRVGSHSTTVTVGNLTYQTRVGTTTLRAGLNSIALDTASGIRMTSVTTINMTSTLATTISALASVTVKSVGQAKLSGIVTTLGGGGKVGRIISSSDRDPLTNLPFSFFGMGSFGHRLGAPL
jgi:hypothetical protein